MFSKALFAALFTISITAAHADFRSDYTLLKETLDNSPVRVVVVYDSGESYLAVRPLYVGGEKSPDVRIMISSTDPEGKLHEHGVYVDNDSDGILDQFYGPGETTPRTVENYHQADFETVVKLMANGLR